jgi:hypothetical protein
MRSAINTSFLTTLVSILSLQVPAYSCSLFYPTVQVGQSFRVRVMDRGQPVHGLPVALDPQFAYKHYKGVTQSQMPKDLRILQKYPLVLSLSMPSVMVASQMELLWRSRLRARLTRLFH